MSKHVMEGKGSGKRKAVKTTKKGSVVGRQLKAAQRQVWNVLGGVGLVTVVIVLVQLARGGW